MTKKDRKKSRRKVLPFQEKESHQEYGIIISDNCKHCVVRTQTGEEKTCKFPYGGNRRRKPEGQWCIVDSFDTYKGKERWIVAYVYQDKDIKILKKRGVNLDEDEEENESNITFGTCSSTNFSFDDI